MIGHIIKSEKKECYVFAFFTAASALGPLSGLLRFLSCSSSRPNPGPFWIAGVGKVRGLGSIALSGPDRPKPHSGKKLDGDGSSASETNLLGNADIGVSMLLLLLYAVVLFCAAPAVVPGGGGLANGFGGPCAPALRIGPAEGEGGGNTTPVWLASLVFAGVAVLLPAEDEDSAVALAPSECSLGI
jgi:hypothetical protein